MGARRCLVGLATLAGVLAVGQTTRADDHWREGEKRGTQLSITSGTVSIGTHVE